MVVLWENPTALFQFTVAEGEPEMYTDENTDDAIHAFPVDEPSSGES